MAFGGSAGSDVSVDGGTIPARDFAQKIAQLQYSGQGDLAKEYLKKYGSQIDPAFLQAAGVSMPKKAGFIQRALTAASPVLNVLNRPLQVAEAGIHDVAGTIAHAVNPNANVENGGYGNILKAVTGHGDFTPEKVMQRNFENFGRFKGLAKFGFEAGLDPLTYVTGGLGGANRGVEAATEILGKTGLEEAGQQIRRAGFKSLAPEAQQGVEAAISGSENVQQMARKAGFLRPAKTAEQAASEIMTQVERGGQSGLRFAGRTVLPYTENTVAALAPVRKGIEIATRPLTAAFEKIGHALTPNAAIRDAAAFGPAKEEVLHKMDNIVEAAQHRGAMDVSRRYSKIFKDAYKDISEGEASIISNALDTGDLATARAQLSEPAQKALDAFDAIRHEEGGSAIFNEGIEAANGSRLRAARPNEELQQIEQQAREAATAEHTATAQASLAKAQEALDKAHVDVDSALKKVDLATQARDAAPSAYKQTRLDILEERARIARKSLKEAEKGITAAEAKTAAKLERVPALAEEAAAKARNEAARSESFLKKSSEYIKSNLLTDNGRKGFAELEKLDPSGQVLQSLQGDLAAIARGGSEKNRVFQGTMPDRNKVWADKLEQAGVKVEGPIFEEDPLKRMAQSSLDIARSTAEIQMLADLTKMTDNLGRPMAITGEDAAKRAKELGYVKVPSHTVEDVYMSKPLLERQKQLNHVLTNDADLKALNDVIDRYSRNWAGLATNFNTPKRFIGDIFNNFLDGVRNPDRYTRALKMQMADRAAGEETGRAVGKEWEASLRKNLGNDRDADWYIEALKRSSESGGLLGGDIQAVGRDIVTGKTKKGLIMKSKPMEFASRMNRMEEGNVRLANFINSMERTGSYDIAQKHVNDILFDYQYLSPTEKAIKKYARFYTYLRNNTPLQVRMMIEKPGIYSNYFRATQGSLPGAGILPQYSIDKGDFRVGKNLLGVGLPIEDAMQNLTPIGHLAGVLPGVKNLVPSELRPEGGVAQVLREGIRPITGGPVELAKAGVEQITGKSLFTGGDITKSTSGRAQQFLRSVLPPAGKFNEPQGGWTPGNIVARALNISVTPINSKTTDGELKRRVALVQGAIDKAVANGTYVPTIQELRDAKLIPSLKESKRIFGDVNIITSVPKTKLTAKQKQEAALAKVTLP